MRNAAYRGSTFPLGRISRTAASNSMGLKGLVRMRSAPDCWARVNICGVPKPVISTTRIAGCVALARSSTSNPEIPGMRTSEITREGFPGQQGDGVFAVGGGADAVADTAQ